MDSFLQFLYMDKGLQKNKKKNNDFNCLLGYFECTKQ